MNEERIGSSPRGLDARYTRRVALRRLAAAGMSMVGVGYLAESTSASPAPRRPEPVEAPLPEPLPHDTPRIAGMGLAAAAVVVAGKLIRDKERDPEL